MSLNLVCLTGNLTREPQLKRTASGMAIMDFGLAVNERRKNNQTGEYEDYANFIDCTMFGSRAEAVSNYLTKGSKVGIQGRLRYSSWEKDGQKRSKLSVIVDEIEFLSPRNGSGGAQGAQSKQQQQEDYYEENAPSYGVYDEDLPF